ncbi:LysR family transcriptional regulator [Mesorhizobium sp. M2A.F.Ca.ET.037.01.1.1]|uniref:LysR family transcriptional regulator n=1 Tax=unclassified Mesorhizobium TaxID=325217 RepID=UPI000F75483B|nr:MULTISPECIES: LysR family transcriptional regulator [unclassified Mesorhizobium]RUY07122.1 LysR family transcriptional regulator [Mesorhizobium sp. M2A.F.Ca.ET.040.01.1.1]RVC59094.1 LysR family transcriptional regulator [Mesorhizobium sp. M00.F.Ca.ET.038.03.1.1]RVC71549.1 LysR family transcriptional regulator [Mesorhizobium sp. M2A.F.Ca.ET.046.02.1.1]AZO03397.1 LysR family transcriptional regulator [Mesorhizobium sp. M2A.F.Ca.ET.043.02.1.1]AZO36516.1 LysR family transcriptional regulator [M
MDRLDAMSLFVATVEAGSLSAAARRAGVPLATVSRKLSDLEKHLKTRLLNRSTRRLVLTDAGQSYLAACRRILDEVNEAERTAAGEYSSPTGELVITAPVVFGRLHVLPVITDFLAIYPQVDVRLTLSDRITQLVEEHIDLALRIGELPDSAMVAIRVGSIRRIVCASPAYLASQGTPEKPSELAGHSCVTFEGLASPATWSFGAGKTETTIPVRSRLQVNTAEAAIDAAIAGLGLTKVLSYQADAGVRAGTLRVVLEPFESPPWPVSLVHAGQGRLPVKLRAFLDFAAPRLKERLARSL